MSRWRLHVLVLFCVSVVAGASRQVTRAQHNQLRYAAPGATALHNEGADLDSVHHAQTSQDSHGSVASLAADSHEAFVLEDPLANSPTTTGAHTSSTQHEPRTGDSSGHGHKKKAWDPCFGFDRPQCALFMGSMSGVSLPIGAAIGIMAHPVKDEVVSMLLAIGAGALLFAVTVELYGHALHEMKRGRMAFWSEMLFIILGALAGSWFYTITNEWLEKRLNHSEEVEEDRLEDHMVDARTAIERHASEILEESHVDAASQQHSFRPERASSLRATPESPQYSASPSEAAHAAHLLHQAEVKTRARMLWMKVRIIFRFGRWVRMEIQKPMQNRDRALLLLATDKPLDDTLMKIFASKPSTSKEEKRDIAKAKALALSLFLGLFIDGVPECMLMGFLAAEYRLTWVLVISLIVANFPEAFSSASLLKRARMGNASIVGLWAGLQIMVGVFCGLTCYIILAIFPNYGPDESLPLGVLIFTSFVEGLAGGAMITLIAAVILPEAMEKADKEGPFYYRSGFNCACGFLLSVCMKVAFDSKH